MKKKFWLGLALLVLMALAVAGCGGAKTDDKNASGSASSGNVIKIATSSPLSGSQSAMGESIKLGAQMAVEEKKEEFKKLGFDLELSPQDDQADPKVGVSIAKKLVSDDPDVLAVVGHLNSGVAIPASVEYNQGNLAMVSPANTAPEVTDRNLAVVNRICTRDDKQGPAGAEFAKSKGIKSVFIIEDKTTYGQGLADQFRKEAKAIGLQELGYEGITAGEVDFSAVLTKVAAVKPDLVYFGGMYPEGGLLAKQAADKGITAKFMGGDGLDNSQIVSIAGPAVTNIWYTTAAAPVSGPEGQAWSERYKKMFNKNVEAYSVYGYDAANVVLNAIEGLIKSNGGKKPTREEVVKAVRATKDFKGIATTITFDSKGDNSNAKVYIFEFKKQAYPGELVGQQ